MNRRAGWRLIMLFGRDLSVCFRRIILKVIVGLGNPGSEYSRTRHNVGFMVLDAFAKKHQVTNWKNKYEAEIGECKIEGEQVLLVKPQTYMNHSGNAVGAIVRWYKLNVEDVVAIYDDMDIPVGNVKLKKHGSSGGHRGVESMLVNLGKEEFARVRVGIGRPLPNWTVVDHVLAKFPEEEQKVIDELSEKLIPAIECIVKQGIDKAMNRFSFKVKK